MKIVFLTAFLFCTSFTQINGQKQRAYLGIGPVVQVTAAENSPSSPGIGLSAQGQYWLNQNIVFLAETGYIEFFSHNNNLPIQNYRAIPVMGGIEGRLFDVVFVQALAGYSKTFGAKKTSFSDYENPEPIQGAFTYAFAVGVRVSKRIDLALKGYNIGFSNANRRSLLNNNSVGMQAIYFL